jgi:hypothetical protein
MLSATEATHDRRGEFRVRYLSTGDEIPITLTGVKAARMASVSAALASIGRGDFPAVPSDLCPRCPHYFICAAVPEET